VIVDPAPDPVCTLEHTSSRCLNAMLSRMDMKRLLGVVLIVLGAAALLYQGISYTSRETVLDIGPLHATADRQKTLPLSPVVGLAALAGGVALLLVGSRKSA
jgi:hypothetical protein